MAAHPFLVSEKRGSCAAVDLGGVVHDGEYVASIASRYGNNVVLMGHSYAGAVIGYAATRTDNVTGLVFVAAAAPTRAQSMSESTADFDDPGLGDALEANVYHDDEDPEPTLDPAQYRAVFAADVPIDITDISALSQRPAASAAFSQPLPVEPAWATTPSWYVVATEDRALHPDAQRLFARRMGAETTEVAASHSVAVSRPDEVAAVVIAAARGVSG